jgi:hypothetical protein
VERTPCAEASQSSAADYVWAARYTDVRELRAGLKSKESQCGTRLKGDSGGGGYVGPNDFGSGTRTIGELLQEREWAVGEIRRLRGDVGRLSRKEDALKIEKEMEHTVDPALSAGRLLRLAEMISMVGLCRSSIYRYVSKG